MSEWSSRLSKSILLFETYANLAEVSKWSVYRLCENETTYLTSGSIPIVDYQETM